MKSSPLSTLICALADQSIKESAQRIEILRRISLDAAAQLPEKNSEIETALNRLIGAIGIVNAEVERISRNGVKALNQSPETARNFAWSALVNVTSMQLNMLSAAALAGVYFGHDSVRENVQSAECELHNLLSRSRPRSDGPAKDNPKAA